MVQSFLSKVALCAAGGAVAAMAVVGTASATPGAAPVAPRKSTDTMTAPMGGGKVHKGYVEERKYIYRAPSFESRRIGTLHRGKIIKIKCKIRRGPVTWYDLAKRPGWVTSRNVVVFDRIPYCRYSGPMDGRMNDAMNEPMG